MSDDRMRFGIFLAPFHAMDEHPTLAIERDFQLVEHLDRLDYDEAWIGEHHSAGFEIIPSPEVFIAAAAERTRRIRLGTVMKMTYMDLKTAWGIVEEMAREHGRQVSRQHWRIVTPMHVAETRERA